MRWSIIRLIWIRELRDQLRDRRTLFMIAVLPILLYPVAGFGVMKLALSFLQQRNVIGVQGAQYLPAWSPRARGLSPLPVISWLSVAPVGPGVPLAGVERALSAAALTAAAQADPEAAYPPVLIRHGDRQSIPSIYFEYPEEGSTLGVRVFDEPMPDADDTQDAQAFLAHVDRTALDNKQVDLLLVIPGNFRELLEKDGRPPLYILSREDDRSRLVDKRLASVLGRWKKTLKEVRLRHLGLPADFDEAFVLHDEARDKPGTRLAAEHLFDALVRIFPFVLVMWSLAGALYPAVDLCAGEKERGTMETLLISPASREEIVWGKFLTTWLFSAATALLNLLSMGITTWLFSPISSEAFRPMALFWSLLLLMPLSAFFSALCLAVGAYARSSKEGQYYLMPLFLVTMPLSFLTLAPGVELNAFYSMVPVTGVALLLQKLMASTAGNVPWMQAVPWLYFLPVLAPMVIYSWLALRWAIEQFQREEVLFREAERLDLRLWLRHLFRDKEALPSAGQAFFCFALLLGLHSIALSTGAHQSLTTRVINDVALVATPALMMVLFLTTRPLEGLALRRAPLRWYAVAMVLGVLLAGALYGAMSQLDADLVPNDSTELRPTGLAGGASLVTALAGFPWERRWAIALLISVVAALCEEIAFRGVILSGLQRRFRPWTAVALSSFLFALFHMDIFLLLPAFGMGLVLALLVWRSRSLGPAIVFHALCRVLLMAPMLVPDTPLTPGLLASPLLRSPGGQVLAVVVCLALASPLLLLLVWPGSRQLFSQPTAEKASLPQKEHHPIPAGAIRPQDALPPSY